MRGFGWVVMLVVGGCSETAKPDPGGFLTSPADGGSHGPGLETSVGGGQQGGGQDNGGNGAGNANADDDNDGLTNEEEAALGSDSQSADSDNDGWTDGEELDENTDPTDASDRPYEMGWQIDACRFSVNGTEHVVGGTADNFSLMSQTGEQVSLHDFCGKAVLLISSAMWCGPCQAEAPHMAGLYDDNEGDLMVITLLGENFYGQAPSQADLQLWADGFGIDHPVLSDGGWSVTARFLDSNYVSLPTMHLLGQDAEILYKDTWVSDNQIYNAL